MKDVPTESRGGKLSPNCSLPAPDDTGASLLYVLSFVRCRLQVDTEINARVGQRSV